MKKKMIIALFIILILALIVFLLTYFTTDRLRQFGQLPEGKRLERIKQSPNYNGERFVNEEPEDLMGWWDGIKMLPRFLNENKETRTPKKLIPIERRTATDYPKKNYDNFRYTWLGHSTMLLEIDDLKILTDPVMGNSVSPSTLIGTNRFYDAPLPLSELTDLEIDLVIISHDHYDHLDRPTILALLETNTIFVTPFGVGSHLEYWGIAPGRIIELDWWESISLFDNKLNLTATPSRHFSGRGIGRFKTLWASWVIKSTNHNLFFSGDAGDYGGFKKIGEQFGPFDLTMIESGAYGDKWLDIHLTPEKTVQAHIDLRGKVLLPIHWGTFDLAMHPWNEPAIRVLESAKKNKTTLVLPHPGQIISIDSLPELDEWWVE